jgi:putative N6-adenine-specific DNA methylase
MIATENAQRAGVSDCVRFETYRAESFKENPISQTAGGIIMTNPPYGQRVMQPEEAEKLYNRFGREAKQLENWKMYILSSHTEFERTFGKKAVKKRKLYNGMIKCDLYMYYKPGGF